MADSDWVEGTPLNIEDRGEYGRGEFVQFRLRNGEVELFDLDYLIETSWIGVWVKWPGTWKAQGGIPNRLLGFIKSRLRWSPCDQKYEFGRNLTEAIGEKLREGGIDADSIPPEYVEVWEYDLVGILRLENEVAQEPAIKLLTERGFVPLPQIVIDTGVGSFGTFHTPSTLAKLALKEGDLGTAYDTRLDVRAAQLI